MSDTSRIIRSSVFVYFLFRQIVGCRRLQNEIQNLMNAVQSQIAVGICFYCASGHVEQLKSAATGWQMDVMSAISKVKNTRMLSFSSSQTHIFRIDLSLSDSSFV